MLINEKYYSFRKTGDNIDNVIVKTSTLKNWKRD